MRWRLRAQAHVVPGGDAGSSAPHCHLDDLFIRAVRCAIVAEPPQRVAVRMHGS